MAKSTEVPPVVADLLFNPGSWRVVLMSSAPRIMVGRMWHESNGFNPGCTTREGFQYTKGAELVESSAASGTTLAGIVDRLKEAGADVLPSLSVTAPPSGLVDHKFYESVRDQLIAFAADVQPDAIALELHGAMGTTQTPDAEGDLLTKLRAAVGPDVPIAVGLDLHGHITPAMLSAADICIACKENPHTDVVECGWKVADSVLAMLTGQLNPIVQMAKIPMVLPGAAETKWGPLAGIHASAVRAANEHKGLWDISIFNVFPYVDDEDIGQAVVITCNGTPEGAAIAKRLAMEFWSRREQFKDNHLPIGDALSVVAERAEGRPFALADMGDRVLAGAPGDSVAILQAALSVRYKSLVGAIPITDPASAALACAAGKGKTITCSVGGGITPGFEPIVVTGKITHVSDGETVLAGPFQAGEKTSLGPTAVLLVDDRISLLLTSNPALTHDPAIFTCQNIDLSSQDFIVVKSGYHFKINFEDIATPLILRTPGVGYYTKGLLQYQRSVFWPEHSIEEALIGVSVFDHRRGLQLAG